MHQNDWIHDFQTSRNMSHFEFVPLYLLLSFWLVSMKLLNFVALIIAIQFSFYSPFSQLHGTSD